MDHKRDSHPLRCLFPKDLYPSRPRKRFFKLQFAQVTLRDFKFELFPLHSPLLGESLLVSFPPLIDMLKFSGFSCSISDQVIGAASVIRKQEPYWIGKHNDSHERLPNSKCFQKFVALRVERMCVSALRTIISKRLPRPSETGTKRSNPHTATLKPMTGKEQYVSF